MSTMEYNRFNCKGKPWVEKYFLLTKGNHRSLPNNTIQKIGKNQKLFSLTYSVYLFTHEIGMFTPRSTFCWFIMIFKLWAWLDYISEYIYLMGHDSRFICGYETIICDMYCILYKILCYRQRLYNLTERDWSFYV